MEGYGMEAHGSLNNHMKTIEVISNSEKAFVRLKHSIWNGGTDRQTDRQTHTHTDIQTDREADR